VQTDTGIEHQGFTDGSRPARAVVLVEGPSDLRAIETLAARRGRHLGSEGVSIVSMAGSKNIGTFLARFGPKGLGVRLAGLCDAREEGDFRRALEQAGLGAGLTRSDMEGAGFYVCDADLEDELIRAVGVDAVERVLAAEGELGAFRTFQKQPAKRGQPLDQQLRRFMGTFSGRKIRYAGLLTEAVDLTRVPRPLDGVLGHV
jgi:hypothetical protein